MVFYQHGPRVERRVKPLVLINRDRVGEPKSAIAHGPLVGEKHAAAVSCIDVQPHAFAIRNAPQFANVIDGPRIVVPKMPITHSGRTPLALSRAISSSMASRRTSNLSLVGNGRSAFRPSPMQSTALSTETWRSSETYTAHRSRIPSC